MESPSVNLAGIRVQEIRGFETVFQIDLRVFNPNKAPLAIQGIDCDLSLNDRHLAKGVANPQEEIPAYGSEIVTVMVYASMLDMVDVARRLIQGAQGETIDEKWIYAVTGHLRLANTAWTGKIPFNAKGDINLKELMPKKNEDER